MRSITYAVAIIALLWVLGIPAPRNAGRASQQATPVSAPVAAGLLPSGDAFGEGWALLVSRPVPDPPAGVFSDTAVGAYGGPNGARLTIAVLRVAPGMTAVRSSWEFGNPAFEAFRGEIDYGYDSSRETSLAATPPPQGCADARRTYGIEEIGLDAFSVGITLCAADPDAIVLVVASGELAGLSGSQASDRAVEVVLGDPRTSAATPGTS